MDRLSRRWSYLPNATLWFKAVQLVALEIGDNWRFCEESLRIQCSTSIQFIISRNSWSRGNLLRMISWRMKIGRDSFLSSRKWTLKRKKKRLKRERKRNTILSHLSSSLERKILPWKQESISSPNKKRNRRNSLRNCNNQNKITRKRKQSERRFMKHPRSKQKSQRKRKRRARRERETVKKIPLKISRKSSWQVKRKSKYSEERRKKK